jgi:sugar/nucleoside kinase (ribokinase family)
LLSTGGAVSNTGLALHALGFKTRLMGKIADDPFGLIIRRLIEARGPQLADSMIVSSGEQSSYTIVISQPGRDRLFLHHSGANDSFGADDLDLNKIAHSRLFHFGYPPLMRRFYNDGGAELTKLFRNVQSRGLTTSMDMAQVDLASEAAKVDWLSLLRKVLPHVDVFLPSLEEILFMLGRERTDVECCSADLLRDVASTLISWGAAIVGLKLGSQGLFLQTSGSEQRMNNIGRCKPSNVKSWIGRQLLAPCFEVEVEGTTGAGDCTIAGFLAGLLAQQSAEDALISAVATGACCVERSDAVSGVPMWEDLQRRIQSGWRQHKPKFQLSGWKPAADRSVIFGPEDPFRAV